MHVDETFDIRKDPFSEKITLHQYTGPGGHIVVPDGVEVIAYISYDRAGTITGITIPDSVSEIYPDAFMHCKGLANQDGFVIIRNVLYQYFGPGGHVVIPEGVEEITYCAFLGQKKVTGVTIPDSVKKIDNATFSGCEGMADPEGFVIFRNYLCSYHGQSKRIVIPHGVTEIDPSFGGVEGLQELVIPDSVQSVHPQLHILENPAHFNLIAPTKVLETIWNNFSPQYKTEECLGYLRGTFARHACYASVIRMYIKKNKKKLFKLICDWDDAVMMEKFLDCLQKVKLEQIDEFISAATGHTNLMAYLLNYKKENFTSRHIQDAEEEVFEKELGLKEKNVADWRKVFRFAISDGCVEIKGYKGTESTVVIPEKIGKNVVTRIGERAFMERSDLMRIILPDSITHIDPQAFICCTGLTEFVIPSGVTYLGNGSFAGCTKITAVKVPPAIAEIRSTTFFACEKLTSAYIPASVTKICSNAFERCPDVTIHAPAGSYAETYAKENNIPFTAES